MATHCSILAWRIPGTEEPSGLPCMGSHRVRHNWSDLAAAAAPWKKSYDKPTQHIKKQKCYFADKGQSIQSYGFSSSHVWIWELDHKENWEPKNWCFWTVILEKTLESLLDSKEIKPVNLKGNQSWIFIGRADAKAEAPTLWPCDARWLDGIPDSMDMSWTSSERWWRTEKPGMLQSMGSQRDGHKKEFINKQLDKEKSTLLVYFLPAEAAGSLRMLEWVAYPFSSRSSQPRNQTRVSCIAGRFFPNWTISKACIHKEWNIIQL